MNRIWTVVQLTVSEALRTRIVAAFLLLIVGVYVLLLATATGDGTVRGKIQMFMSYSIGLTHFLLSLLVTFLACRTLDQDVKTQRIDSVVTKPIARWQFLLGRWIGIVFLAFILFAAAMGGTYATVRYYASTAVEKTEDKFRIDNQVLVARRSFLPPEPDFGDQVERRYQQLKAEGALTEGKPASEVRKMIHAELLRQSRTVDPDQSQTWVFTGLPQPKAGDVLLTLRFKYEPSGTLSRDTEAKLMSDTFVGRWIIGRKESAKRYVWQEEKPTRSLYEINIPVSAVEKDGTLPVSFFNVDPRKCAVHFPSPDGMEVLVREGTFTPNFVRVVIIVFCTILFIATLAVVAATFLSFPIAALFTLSAFFIGMAGNFLAEAVGLTSGGIGAKNFIELVEKIIAVISLYLVPVLAISPYTDNLLDGKIVDWTQVLRQAGMLVAFKGGLLAVLGAIIFQRRELGKVIV